MFGSGSATCSLPPGTCTSRAGSTPLASRSAATSRDGTTSAAAVAAARWSACSCQRLPRGVVASGCRRQATSCTVTTSRLWLPRRSIGAARDTECTTSKPAGARSQPRSHARVMAGPGRCDAMIGLPNWARGSDSGPPRPPGARLAKRVSAMSCPTAGCASSPASSPRAYAPMPPGTRRRSCSTATRTERGRLRHRAGHPGTALELGPAALPREATDPGGPAANEARPQLLVVEAAVEGPGQAVRSPGSTSRAPSPRTSGSEPTRSPRRGRRPAWPGEAGIRTPHNATGRPARARRAAAQPVRAVRPTPCGRCARGPATRPAQPQLVLSPPLGTGQDQGHIAVTRRRHGEGAHEAGQVLARLRRPDGQDVAGGAGGEQAPPAARPPRPRHGGEIGHPRSDGADADGVGPEGLHHLAGHELGIGVHPRTAGQGPPDQARDRRGSPGCTARDGAPA